MVFVHRPCRGFFGALVCAAFFALFVFMTGCETPGGRRVAKDDEEPTTLQLAAGDMIEVTFPGATNLSGVHRIGPEGTVTMPLIGQVKAAGKTAQTLQDDLQKLYEKELQNKEVIVAIVGSANQVYVTGAVLRPGPIQLARPLTALEVIMEAGGFAENANRKKITIVRYEKGQNTTIHLDMEGLLTGRPVRPFYVRARDIIHVPTKMQWF